MKELKFLNKMTTRFNALSAREKKLSIVMIIMIVLFFFGVVILPRLSDIKENFVNQGERLKKAEKAVEQAKKIIGKYIILRKKQSEIEKTFGTNTFKEGHLSYFDSLKLTDMTKFSIGEEQKKDFGKDFTQVTYRINFGTPSLATVIGFIKSLENKERKYLISELDINKNANLFMVAVEVNSIEKK